MSVPLTSILGTQQQAPVLQGQQQTDPNAQQALAAQQAAGAAQQPDWRDSLPAEYREDAHIKSHGDMASLLAEYGVLKTNSGQSNVPDWNAPYENHKDFFSKIGVPESYDKYQLNIPQDFPVDQFPINNEFVSQMQKIAHEAKIPQAAFEKFAQAYFGLESGAIQQQMASQQSRLAESDQVLQQKWGVDSTQRVEFAKRGFQEFADPGTIAELAKDGITTNPHFIHLMSEIGRAMAQPQSPGGRSTAGTAVQSQMITSPEQAREAINQMYANPEKAKIINDPKHPQHKQVNAELTDLYLKTYKQ